MRSKEGLLPHHGHRFWSLITWRTGSTMIRVAATTRSPSGPQRVRQVGAPERGPHAASRKRTPPTRSMRAAVVYRLTVWPSARAEADTVPLTNPITRAGQHQAPMRAGTLSRRAKKERRRPLRSVSIGADDTTTSVASTACTGLSAASSSWSLRLLVEVLGSGRGSVRGLGL